MSGSDLTRPDEDDVEEYDVDEDDLDEDDLDEDDLTEDDLGEDERPWWWPSVLLTGEPAAITAFAFAVLTMFGGATSAHYLAQAVIGFDFGPTDLRAHFVLGSAVMLAFGVASVLLAAPIARYPEAETQGWPAHLARAAVVIGSIGVAMAGVALVAALLHNPPVA